MDRACAHASTAMTKLPPLTPAEIHERFYAPRPPPAPAHVRYREAWARDDFYACVKIEREYGLLGYDNATVLALLTVM